MDSSQKLELRQFLSQFLIRTSSGGGVGGGVSSFIRNKLVHVIVLIGREDWPHDYPDFLDHMIQVREIVISMCTYTSLPPFLFLLLPPLAD